MSVFPPDVWEVIAACLHYPMMNRLYYVCHASRQGCTRDRVRVPVYLHYLLQNHLPEGTLAQQRLVVRLLALCKLDNPVTLRGLKGGPRPGLAIPAPALAPLSALLKRIPIPNPDKPQPSSHQRPDIPMRLLLRRQAHPAPEATPDDYMPWDAMPKDAAPDPPLPTCEAWIEALLRCTEMRWVAQARFFADELLRVHGQHILHLCPQAVLQCRLQFAKSCQERLEARVAGLKNDCKRATTTVATRRDELCLAKDLREEKRLPEDPDRLLDRHPPERWVSVLATTHEPPSGEHVGDYYVKPS